MFSAISRFLKETFFGQLVHGYELIEVQHGNITCTDKFELRNKAGRYRLFHIRIWEDGHDVKRTCPDYGTSDVTALTETFQTALQVISEDRDFDFGVVLTETNGSMQSSTRFYVQSTGGQRFLYSTEESSVEAMTTDGYESSEDSHTTYYPTEEVRKIADVLVHAEKLMHPA